MALSNAERQRRYRQRLKERASRNGSLREAVEASCRQRWEIHGNDKSGEKDHGPQSAQEEAERELRELNALIERWLRDQGYTFGGEPDDEMGQRVVDAARRLVT